MNHVARIPFSVFLYRTLPELLFLTYFVVGKSISPSCFYAIRPIFHIIHILP